MRIAVSVVVIFLALASSSLGEELFLQRTHQDGQEIIYFYYGTIVGKQTIIPNYEREGLKLREVTDGTKLVQAIYIDDSLEDCVVTKNPEEADALKSEVEEAAFLANRTALQSMGFGPEFTWLNLRALAKDCKKRQKQLLRPSLRKRRSLYKPKPRRHSTAKIHRTRHDRLAMGHKYSLKQNLITPGTKWCGPNNQALQYNDLGGFWKADKCCRKHDSCGESIAPHSFKFAVTNQGPFTLSHCGCDRRFRKCLKMANTGAANFVGKLFFNFVQNKCFVIKTEKICTKRSWTGKCQKSSYESVGHIRNNLHY